MIPVFAEFFQNGASGSAGERTCGADVHVAPELWKLRRPRRRTKLKGTLAPVPPYVGPAPRMR
jgi:hypothetical protein